MNKKVTQTMIFPFFCGALLLLTGCSGDLEKIIKEVEQENQTLAIQSAQKKDVINGLQAEIRDIEKKISVNNDFISASRKKSGTVEQKKVELVHPKKEVLQPKKEVKKSDEFLPDEWNSKGELHPRVKWSNGDTKINRIGDFAEKNCSKEVQDTWKHGVEYSIENFVDPAILFAVIWADTQCGHALTTPNNFGNVGNNDRGHRMGFFTPEEGIEAVVDTLNNKYMGGIEKLGHLSQGGRLEIGSKHSCADAPAPYKCYATSPENWHKNARRALASIFQDSEVDGNFVFRY